MGSLLHHDEELAAGGVGGHGAGHGQHAPVVDQVVLEAVSGELPLDGVAGAAHAGAVGAAALDHEAGDNPVEDQAVVVALLDQADEIVDRVGGHVGVELRLHDAAVPMGFCAMGNTPFLRAAAPPSSDFQLIPAVPGFHGPVHLPFGVLSGRRLPLVIELLALGQADLQLDPGAAEVDGQGDEGVPVLLDAGEEF